MWQVLLTILSVNEPASHMSIPVSSRRHIDRVPPGTAPWQRMTRTQGRQKTPSTDAEPKKTLPPVGIDPVPSDTVGRRRY